MYKLFLTLRYLTRKAIVIFPILVVWLCVMMLIIVTSIMGGFVDRVQEANRGLMGDVIIESSRNGFPHYDELQKRLAALPEVEFSTPVVHAYGLINFPDLRANTFAQIIGIDPAGRARISQFQQSLFREHVAPLEAAEDLQWVPFPTTGAAIQKVALDRWDASDKTVEEATTKYFALVNDPVRLHALEVEASTLSVVGVGCFLAAFLVALLGITGGARWYALLAVLATMICCGIGLALLAFFEVISPAAAVGAEIGLVVVATLVFTFAAAVLKHRWVAVASTVLLLSTAVCLVLAVLAHRKPDRLDDAVVESRQLNQRAMRTFRVAMALDPKRTIASHEELVKEIVPATPTFTPAPSAKEKYANPDDAPKYGCIVGADLGLYDRDKKGNYDRRPFTEDIKAILTVVPITAKGNALFTNPQEESFTVVDDSYTRVFDVDSTYVYAPFEVVQKMTLMSGGVDEDTGVTLPPRCNEIQIKVKEGDDPAKLVAAAKSINKALDSFRKDYGNDFAIQNLPDAQTWDQKQAKYINAVKNEKTMLTFILGLMSVVVLVVIFLIFYMIVRDKTRDIGIIKALGGSEEGVAAIFLLYGLFIGTVGGALGTFCGVMFVHHTNWIHDKLLYGVFGVTIWDRSVYLFDRIPDTVNGKECFLYLLLAIVAGGVGALLPAILAGTQDPVKAVRYE